MKKLEEQESCSVLLVILSAIPVVLSAIAVTISMFTIGMQYGARIASCHGAC